ncbi:TetR/AcrR family transcriptional regulator [Nocardioides marmoriginsengisoli]|uniref:TetR/AcrR family transcriptional regulator n=1 Tax=Nocardioides marmoriginsengisoli TaxID=661483 RepID=A0A3N0CG59_9ACTN|nr:TetR/AcrR family transcriptional regulator [Nocardioides marmoriginsengisoli]RNL62444.1 TetR/AcrR family transcriptional regulator [Nocardioides marmoriginsengisoli]
MAADPEESTTGSPLAGTAPPTPEKAAGTSRGRDPGGLTKQGLRTRRQLLRGAKRAFEKQGYHRTRVADITTAARTAVGSFYTYFDSKEEVFHLLLVELENEVFDEPTRLPRDAAPYDRLRDTNRLYFEAFRRNAAFWAVVEEAAMRDEKARLVLTSRHQNSRERTESAFRIWQEQGIIPAHVDIAFCATALGAMTERCAFLWFVLGEPFDFDEGVERVTAFWAQALQIPPA